jgi:hypothetical protein
MALLVGCKQEVAIQPDAVASAPAVMKPLESLSREAQLAHYKANLVSLGQVTAQLGKEAAFRQLLYKKIEERFDGDYNVLFNQLGEITLNGAKVLDHMQRASTSGRVSARHAMNAFFNIKGVDFFPQVFIPFYEDLEAAGKLGKQEVTIVIHPGDDTVNEAPGYALNERNELVPTGRMIDADYLRNNEVWVISLNERVNSLAEIAALSAPAKTEKAGRTQASSGFMFGDMLLKEHLEGVFSGENDVRFAGDVNFANEKYPNGEPCTVKSLTSADGRAIAKWTKRETEIINEFNRRGTWKHVNWPFMEFAANHFYGGKMWIFPGTNGAHTVHGDWLWFVLFEHDGYPESVKSVAITNPVSPYKTYNVLYRSAQSACASRCLTTSQFISGVKSPYYMGFFNSYDNTDRVEYDTRNYF